MNTISTTPSPSSPYRASGTAGTGRHATRTAALAIAASMALLAGCENMSARERGTAQGAGIGAVAGAVIGSTTGGSAGGSAAAGAVVGAIAGNLWSKRMEDRKREMERATQGTGVEVSRTDDNRLKLNVPNDVSFDVGSAAIRPQLRGVLDPFAASLRDDPNTRIDIIGHTDSTGSNAINEPLSMDRAHSVRDYLVARGVNFSRIQTAGRAAREPVADNNTDAGRAMNRRVEIFLREPEQRG
jgi:outer membrane protein OmpA-like peptidoglycan-associated protein